MLVAETGMAKETVVLLTSDGKKFVIAEAEISIKRCPPFATAKRFNGFSSSGLRVLDAFRSPLRFNLSDPDQPRTAGITSVANSRMEDSTLSCDRLPEAMFSISCSGRSASA
jgi:hypothetical protein